MTDKQQQGKVYVADFKNKVLKQKATQSFGRADHWNTESEAEHNEAYEAHMQYQATLKQYPATWLTEDMEGRELVEGVDFELQWEYADIHSDAGTKVRPYYKNGELQHGHDWQKKDASAFIKEGDVLTIDYTNVENWSSDFYFKEFPGKSFNSVHFVKEYPIPVPIPKPQAQNEPKTAFIPEIELPSDQAHGREEILKKHIGTVDGFHNLTAWHKGFIYKAMEEYAIQLTSSIPTEVQKEEWMSARQLFDKLMERYNDTRYSWQRRSCYFDLAKEIMNDYKLETPVSSAPPISHKEDEKSGNAFVLVNALLAIDNDCENMALGHPANEVVPAIRKTIVKALNDFNND